MRYCYELTYDLNGKEDIKVFTNTKSMKEYIQVNKINKVYSIKVIENGKI